MSVTSGNETAGYLDRVAAALADVPAEDRDELLDDLRTHLDEVAAELAGQQGATLESRLGTPEEYAAELRASAGFGPPSPRRDRRSPRALARAAWARPEVGAAVDFLPELRPAWWVLRGIALALIVAHLLSLSWIVGAVLAVPAVVLSVRWGRRPAGDRLARATLVTVNAIALLALAGLFVLRADGGGVVYSPPVGYEVTPAGPEWQVIDGGALTNIYPYDSSGRPLHDVLLYDQDGNPISLTGQAYVDQRGQLERHLPYGADGHAVTNAFPQEQSYTDDSSYPPVITRQRPPVVRPPVFAPAAPLPSK